MISYCMVDWPGRALLQAIGSALDEPPLAIARAGMKLRQRFEDHIDQLAD